MSNVELVESEEERRRVQCKLTDICGDIWDYASRYQLSMNAKGILNEERATLRRIVSVLELKLKGAKNDLKMTRALVERLEKNKGIP